MRIHLLFSLILLCFPAFSQNLPKLSSGTLRRFENVPSQFVSARNVDVWLPDGYSPDNKYPVLYMHDGQMLFDASTTWNKSAWDVDEVAGKLIKEQRIRPFLVVGVWNGGNTRHADYFPQKAFEALTQAEKDTIYSAARTNGYSVFNDYEIHSDDYLKFLVQELKPMIDQHFSTLSDRENTFIMGSSMGGLISCYAICEYPDVFGGAACLSTHWPGIFTMENNPFPDAMIQYLAQHLPDPPSHKLYFDCGDQTLDAMYPLLQTRVDEAVKAKGYTDQNWMSQFFAGEDHSERAWNKRLDVPLLFLFKIK